MNLLDLIANGGTDLANALGVTPPDTPDVTQASALGLRNNNPGNIRVNPGLSWNGQTGSNKGFVTFQNPVQGIQALTQNLIAKPKLHQLYSVHDIINNWAPPSENNTNQYVNYVAGKMQVDPNAKLPISFFQNPSALQSMVGAIISKENGQNPYTQAQLQQGVSAGVQSAWRKNPTVQAQFSGLPQINNQPGVVGGGNLPPARNIGGQGPMTGVNGVIQSIVKPPVQAAANTLAGNDTPINQAVGAPIKQGVDDVNNLAAQAVQSGMDTFKGGNTWPNNVLSSLIGGQIQGINNSLTNAITPIVQPAAQAEQNGMNSAIGGLNKGLSGMANVLNQGQQAAQQAARQALATNQQAAQAAKQKAAGVANMAANAVAGQAQAAQMPQAPGAAPAGIPGSGQAQPQQPAQGTPDGPMSDAESAQYLSMPVDQNTPPAAMQGPMGVNQLPTLANSQAGPMQKFNNFIAGAQHEIGDKVSGIQQIVNEFQGNADQAQKIAADRARQNDAFQISTGQTPGVNLLNPSQNPGGWAADVGMGGPIVAGAGALAAPMATWAMHNPMKTIGMGYAATHANNVQGLLHLLSQLGVAGGG